MANRVHDPVISAIERRGRVGPELQVKPVMVYHRRPNHATTLVQLSPTRGMSLPGLGSDWIVSAYSLMQGKPTISCL